mgnify:CR=1 FL=1
MMKLKITNELKKLVTSFKVSCYTFTTLEKNDKENLSNDLTEAFNNIAKEYQEKYILSEVTKIPKLKSTRDGYKMLGKDPSHTRPACEALVRRIIRDGSIYRLGNLIDFGNYLSIKLMKSVCMVDLDKIQGDVTIRIGSDSDYYEGINRGIINVTNLPLYTDEIGPFGNPTSDTIRTAITNDTTNVLIMLIHFDDNIEDEDEMLLLLNKYLKITNLTKIYEENNIYCLLYTSPSPRDTR